MLNKAAQKTLILVVPTKNEEPFGLTGIEGQAAGLVTIGSNTGGIPEWCLHKETGLLFEGCDLKDLSEKIERVLMDRNIREKLLNGARIHLKQNFDRLTNIRNTLHFYDQIIANHQKIN